MAKVKAYVLVNLKPGYEQMVIKSLKRLAPVTAVDGIFGKYDLHVTVVFDSLTELDDFVMDTVRGLPGVIQTTTLLCINV